MLKNIIIILLLFSAGSCVRMRHYHITLSEKCVAIDSAKFRKEELVAANTKGKSYNVIYNDYTIGTIKFENNYKITFNSQAEADNQKTVEIKTLVDYINKEKQIELKLSRYFEMYCFSSEYVPVWAQYQDVEIAVELDDPNFLSALKYYLNTKEIILI